MNDNDDNHDLIERAREGRAAGKAAYRPGTKWRYGCDAPVTVYVPTRYDYRAVERPCGSTGPNGDVVQCERCARAVRPPPTPAYGDDLYDGE